MERVPDEPLPPAPTPGPVGPLDYARQKRWDGLWMRPATFKRVLGVWSGILGGVLLALGVSGLFWMLGRAGDRVDVCDAVGMTMCILAGLYFEVVAVVMFRSAARGSGGR